MGRVNKTRREKMRTTLVEIVKGKKSIEIVSDSYDQRERENRLTFHFCSNGYQSTGVTLSTQEIEMLEAALIQLKAAGAQW